MDVGAALQVLLVEDDESTLEVLETYLQMISSSFSTYGLPPLPILVHKAHTGEAAWDLLRANQIDIALVDIQLPGITGLDLSWCYSTSVTESSIETGVEQPSTAMIACTSDIDASQLYAHGMLDVLRKPVRMKALRHMLHKWIPRVVEGAGIGPELGPSSLPRGGSSGFLSQRILLVDDCQVTVMAMQHCFQEMGLWLETAQSGEEAMGRLSNIARSYDLVLTDVHLPEMSGYALCSWYKDSCREQGRKPALVVAVTSDPDLQICREFGLDHCLPKPLTARMCSRVLHRWMSIRRSAAEAEAAIYGEPSAGASMDSMASSTDADIRGLDALDIDNPDSPGDTGWPTLDTPPPLPPGPPSSLLGGTGGAIVAERSVSQDPPFQHTATPDYLAPEMCAGSSGNHHPGDNGALGVPRAAHPEDALRRALNVLVVEDDSFILQVYRSIFDHFHQTDGVQFSLETTASVTGALEMLCKPRENPVDVVILDMGLATGRTGDEAIAPIRDQLGERAVVACISGYSKDALAQRCLLLGADFYLQKPVSRQAIQQLWKHWFVKNRERVPQMAAAS